MRGFTFIEIKTTGMNPVLDKIVHISLTQFSTDLRAMKSYSTWLNPEIPLSKAQERFFNLTNKEIKSYPTFTDLVDVIYPLIEGKKLGIFESKYDVIEFLKEELFYCGIKFKYLKKNLIQIKKLEDKMYPRDVSNLYYKYLGTHIKPSEDYTKEMGEIFKAQCKTIGVKPDDLQYHVYVPSEEESRTRYFKKVDGEIVLNFGKFKNTEIKKVKKTYLEWIVETDFPWEVKEIVKEYLNNKDGDE